MCAEESAAYTCIHVAATYADSSRLHIVVQACSLFSMAACHTAAVAVGPKGLVYKVTPYLFFRYEFVCRKSTQQRHTKESVRYIR